MEAAKCPVCKAISPIKEVPDGEMLNCPYCKAKFTLTRLRRFNLLAQSLEKCDSQLPETQSLQFFMRGLENEKLLLLVKMVIHELTERYKKKEDSRL